MFPLMHSLFVCVYVCVCLCVCSSVDTKNMRYEKKQYEPDTKRERES